MVGSALDGGLFTAGVGVGFDFNPTVDRLRIVNSANDNLRFNPVTSAIVEGDTVTGGTQAETVLLTLSGVTGGNTQLGLLTSATLVIRGR